MTAWNEIPPRRPCVFSAFLGKISRNLAIDKLRKRKASRRMDGHMVDITVELERFEERLQYSLEDRLKSEEIIKVLNGFLKNLKPEDRDFFIRRYWYMDDIRQIAKRHKCSESRVKSSLFRSRNTLWEGVKELI